MPIILSILLAKVTPYDEWLITHMRTTHMSHYLTDYTYVYYTYEWLMWRDSFVLSALKVHAPFLTWLVCICDMIHMCVVACLPRPLHLTRVTWLIHICAVRHRCDMTRSWHDSFVTWLVRADCVARAHVLCDLFCSCIWHDSLCLNPWVWHDSFVQTSQPVHKPLMTWFVDI